MNEESSDRDGAPPKSPAAVVVDGGDPAPVAELDELEAVPACDAEADPANAPDARAGAVPAVAFDPEVGSPEIIAEEELGGFAPPAVADAAVNALPVSDPG